MLQAETSAENHGGTGEENPLRFRALMGKDYNIDKPGVLGFVQGDLAYLP